jgi:hypothetical protein
MDHIVKEAIEILLHAENFRLHIKLYKPASNQFIETLSKTSNRQTWPRAMTYRILPPTREVAFYPAPVQRCTQHRVGHLVISFCSTKPPTHPEYGDRVSSQTVGTPSHLSAAVCPRIFNCIHITVRDLQSCQPITNYNPIMFKLHFM